MSSDDVFVTPSSGRSGEPLETARGPDDETSGTSIAKPETTPFPRSPPMAQTRIRNDNDLRTTIMAGLVALSAVLGTFLLASSSLI